MARGGATARPAVSQGTQSTRDTWPTAGWRSFVANAGVKRTRRPRHDATSPRVIRAIPSRKRRRRRHAVGPHFLLVRDIVEF